MSSADKRLKKIRQVATARAVASKINTSNKKDGLVEVVRQLAQNSAELFSSEVSAEDRERACGPETKSAGKTDP